jgi:hypothetical protein
MVEADLNLRKVLFSFGLIILLVGLIQLGVGSIRTAQLKQLTSTANSWEVSGNLTAGNTYVLYIYSSYKWRDDFDAGEYTTPQPVEVVITSPNRANTTLQAYFYAELPTSESNISVRGALPSNVQVEYRSVDYNDLSVDASYAQPRFAVKSGGMYTAIVVEDNINWTSGPPENMIFEEEVVENPYSFTNLLQISGVACLATGAVISAGGARTSQKMGIKRKTKRDKNMKK